MPKPTEPDLVDRVIDYLRDELAHMPIKTVEELRDSLRREFAGEKVYIYTHAEKRREETKRDVLNLFNGRNASEVARKLNLSRATVYRILKQPGQPGQPGQPA